MEGLQVVESLIQQGDFMIKLDLKDAYYALLIHDHSQSSSITTEHTSFNAFPLACPQRAFTKILKQVLECCGPLVSGL